MEPRVVAAAHAGRILVVDLADDRLLARSTGADLADAWTRLPGVARALVEAVLVATPEEAEAAARLGLAGARIATDAPAEAHDVVGLAPGEEVALETRGLLAGFAWRPSEAFQPLYVLPFGKMEPRDALALVRRTTRSGRVGPLDRARLG